LGYYPGGRYRGRGASRDGRLMTIADAGHMLHHDQPARVAAAIEPFLAA
jgi:pimeloyl-ACP methyl ester carboxylesterase